ncbi:MAG: SCO family protein [Pseudomonadales bacterium]|nr:SCO family protein [Pseudomonadales bacterium]
MSENSTHSDRQNGIRNTVVGIVIFITVVLALFINRVSQERILSPKEMVANGAIMFSMPREISALSLIDQNQLPFTKSRFADKWTLVFFGFTHCPDICPTTLALLNQVSDELAETDYAVDTQFLLVSLDPLRDTPEKMKPYVEYFNTDFIGVTGEFLSIHRFAKQLNIAFQKVVTDSETGDYTIDHGGNVALINPQGHYHGFYKPPLDVNRMVLTYKSVRADNR